MASSLKLIAIDQEEVDETKLEVTLLSDLTAPVPNDVTLDFEVIHVTLAEDKFKLAVLIDNELPQLFTSSKVTLTGLEDGYHLMRTFLIDPLGGCVKSPLAYVEAEFYAVKPAPPREGRGFMFGQPSLCHLSPRRNVFKSSASSIKLDFFVNNCELSAAAHGYQVRVYVNDKVVGTVMSWSLYELTGLTALDRQLRVKLVLINPAGDEVLFPAYNCEVQNVEVKTKY